MLHSACGHLHRTNEGIALFSKYASTMELAGKEIPVFCLVRTSLWTANRSLQLGFPHLPEPGSQTFFSVLRHWLTDCDTFHRGCDGHAHALPARLIHVGTKTTPALRLVDTRLEETPITPFIALSHPWEDVTQHVPYCTRAENEAEFRIRIPEQDLPQTFADAVRSTRELSVQYLWIDSLCIICGPDGDFKDLAKTMGDVFSGLTVCLRPAEQVISMMASSRRDHNETTLRFEIILMDRCTYAKILMISAKT